MNKLITLDNLTTFHDNLLTEFGATQYTYVIDNQEKFDTFANQTPGNDYSYVAIIGGGGSGENGEYILTNKEIDCPNTREIIGFKGATITVKTANNQPTIIIKGNQANSFNNYIKNLKINAIMTSVNSNSWYGYLINYFCLENCYISTSTFEETKLGTHYLIKSTKIIDTNTGNTVASFSGDISTSKSESGGTNYYLKIDFTTAPDEDLTFVLPKVSYTMSDNTTYYITDLAQKTLYITKNTNIALTREPFYSYGPGGTHYPQYTTVITADDFLAILSSKSINHCNIENTILNGCENITNSKINFNKNNLVKNINAVISCTKIMNNDFTFYRPSEYYQNLFYNCFNMTNNIIRTAKTELGSAYASGTANSSYLIADTPAGGFNYRLS